MICNYINVNWGCVFLCVLCNNSPVRFVQQLHSRNYHCFPYIPVYLTTTERALSYLCIIGYIFVYFLDHATIPAMNTHICHCLHLTFLSRYAPVIDQSVKCVPTRIQNVIVFVWHIRKKFTVFCGQVFVFGKFFPCVRGSFGVNNNLSIL